jgi:transcriptional regulator with XRE-family HTH domain
MLNNNVEIGGVQMISPLRQKRFFSEMTIYDLSIRTGIDPARISLLERNYKVPQESEKRELAKALSCRVSEIFPNDKELNV